MKSAATEAGDKQYSCGHCGGKLEFLPGADSLKCTYCGFENVIVKSSALPVWLSAYRFQDKVYRILINARTGEVKGERPYSAWKIVGTIVAFFGSLVLFFLFFVIIFFLTAPRH